MSAQLASSPSFPIIGATSPPADVAMPLRRVMLPSHGAKTSSLPPLHFNAMPHPGASPLEQKPKH
jgi:hypothetical protein